MTHCKEVERLIIVSLSDAAQLGTIESNLTQDVLPTDRICLEDIREPWQVSQLTSIGNVLRQLKGKTVRDVILENIPDMTDNPL